MTLANLCRAIQAIADSTAGLTETLTRLNALTHD